MTDVTQTFAYIIGGILGDLAFLGVAVFVFSYGLFFRWTETDAGKSIMAFASSIAAITLLGVIFRYVGMFPGYEWIRFFLYLVAFLACWGMVFTLWVTRYKREHINIQPRTFARTESFTVNNNDRIISYIRTGVPGLIGVLLTYLVSRIPAVADILTTIDAHLALLGFAGATVNGLLVAGGTALAITGYYALARWLGEKYPALEKWLLGRSAVPVYLQPKQAEIVTENVPVPEERKASVTFGEDVVISEDPTK